MTETLMLCKDKSNVCTVDTSNVLDVNNTSQINVKFPLPRTKLENNFPTSDKTLTSIMTDFIFLTETKNNYNQSRDSYLENLLNEERIRSISKRKNNKRCI